MMSPTLNNSLKFFLVQDISLYSIIPLIFFSVSILALNWFSSLTIATCHPIDCSNKKLFSIFSNQSLLYSIFFNGPLQHFLLSYAINPLRRLSVAIFCNSRLIGVLILYPCL